MQQGHPRHKQLRRARYEMAIHKRYMFAKKINESIGNAGKAIVETINSISHNIMHVFDSKPNVVPNTDPHLELANIYDKMNNRGSGVLKNYRRQING
ncbi:hypothetical protein [Leuconostoc mesenteroides]|uniref:hypothetical protein n=1 Tax=Leuconostoc mesenteroides TaxID=1245 RepID=UPI0023624084|nr:hypothetical protein [Leuconostoc mesenteroides]